MNTYNNNRNLMDLLAEKNDLLSQQAEESWQAKGEVSISPAEWNFLLQVQQKKATAAQLARRCGISRQAAHKFYTNLKSKGLVSIEQSSPRQRLIVLTSLGEKCLTQYIDMQQELENSIMHAVGKDNVALLKRILTKEWLSSEEKQAQ